MFFLKASSGLDPRQFLFTLAWLWRQSVRHAVGLCKGQQDKHMASEIIEAEVSVYVGLCLHVPS